MAISGVIGAVSANGENGLILRDLRQQVGKGLAITDGVGRHFDRPDIQALGIDRDVNLSPEGAHLGPVIQMGVGDDRARGLDELPMPEHIDQ
jgi:hypothetical protein